MKRMLRWLPILLLFWLAQGWAQSAPPKREFRGAWIATVTNLDWPSAPGLPPDAQRRELIRLLDELGAAGINAVVFQVRPECDALYDSPLEPWSFWLTGRQGQPPEPYYDPLSFAVEEAHKRGMELHAWFNPYRAVRTVNSYANDPNHVSVQHPEWIITIGTFKFLDPGLPQVRQHVTNVIMDVVNRYDVDGVHCDDYFYPYPPNQITYQDDNTFATYSRGFTNRGDWRRDNVNLLIQMVHDSIQVVQPHVKFGMSPFGIWKNGVPPGITGLDAYNDIYCDAVTWLNRQIIDYVAPQLYWPYGGGQDYGKLMPWWASQTNGRHLYVGQAVYRIGTWPSADEMPRHIRANRANPNAHGSIFFRALNFRENPKGFTDTLKVNYHRYPALAPIMAWKDAVPPNPPYALRYTRAEGEGVSTLQWQTPLAASDGDTASRYALYRFDRPTVVPADLDDARNMLLVSGSNTSRPPVPPNRGGSYYYLVTALDRNTNESDMSAVLDVSPPAIPMLAAPANGDTARTVDLPLRWFYAEHAGAYDLQVGLEQTFTGQVQVSLPGLLDTVQVVSGLEGRHWYYWRVRATNPAGTGEYSLVGNFYTGYPQTVRLASPSNNVRDVPLAPTLAWRVTAGAERYRLQVAENSAFDSAAVLFDVTDIVDTSYTLTALEADKFHFWRVRAENTYGSGAWSTPYRFRTTTGTAVAEADQLPARFELYQNYPNPFNPITTIAFDLPEAGAVRLKIFDVLGREVITIVDHEMAAGHHRVPFDGRLVSSGVYYYRLEFAGRVLTRRMLLAK